MVYNQHIICSYHSFNYQHLVDIRCTWWRLFRGCAVYFEFDVDLCFDYSALFLFEQSNCIDWIKLYYMLSLIEMYVFWYPFHIVYTLSIGKLVVNQFTSCWLNRIIVYVINDCFSISLSDIQWFKKNKNYSNHAI